MGRPKTFQPDDVVDAVIAVYREKGVRNSSMNDFARLAGISRSSVYVTFGSRREVLAAAVERYGARFRGPGVDQLGGGAPRAAVLGLFVADAPGAWCLLVDVVLAEPRMDPRVADVIKRALGDLERRIGDAILRGQVLGEIAGTVDAEQVARVLAGHYFSIRVLSCSGFAHGRTLAAAAALARMLLPRPG